MGQDTVQTVQRALMVLGVFNSERPEMGQSEIARAVQLPRTIVGRILNTLEQARFVERTSDDSRYRIGLAAFEVGALYAEQNPLLALADEELTKLVRECGYTVYLGTIEGSDCVILRQYEGSHPVRFLWFPGDRVPASTGALSKAMLLHLSPAELDGIVGTGTLPSETDHSLKSRLELDRDLQRARERGWSAIKDESYPDVSAVGAAVLDANGRPIAGISISFLTYASAPDRADRLGALVQSAASSLSTRVQNYQIYGRRPSFQLELGKSNLKTLLDPRREAPALEEQI